MQKSKTETEDQSGFLNRNEGSHVLYRIIWNLESAQEVSSGLKEYIIPINQILYHLADLKSLIQYRNTVPKVKYRENITWKRTRWSKSSPNINESTPAQQNEQKSFQALDYFIKSVQWQ